MKTKCLNALFWASAGLGAALFVRTVPDLFSIASAALCLSGLLILGSRNLPGQLLHFLLLITVCTVCFIIETGSPGQKDAGQRFVLLLGGTAVWTSVLNGLKGASVRSSLIRGLLFLAWILLCMCRPKAGASACLLLSFIGLASVQMKAAGLNPEWPAFWRHLHRRRLSPSAMPDSVGQIRFPQAEQPLTR